MTQRHRAEIERALRFIADRLDQPITAAEVARAAHLSEFHFHRVFHAELGEPIGRFVTRRRLELSALRLAYERDRSITDIALSSGYSSTSNFAKAFKSYFGSSPSEVREGQARPEAIGKLTAQYGKQFRPSDLYVVPPELDDDARRVRATECVVRIETSAGIDFACVSGPGGYGLSSLEPLWQDLIARCRELGISGEAVDAWGIPFDSPAITAPELCRYHACVPCAPEQPLAPPLFRGRMPEGRFAVFTYDGAVEGLDASYRTIFSCWFPLSALAPDDLTPYQRYIGDEPKDGRVKLETWLKIRPRTA
ncbi:MAG TPA: AraC family transcriptional regulator [Polyangiales bacterium]|nr:AraC family transcriptional regulator [Polyangiales bacterium]